MSYEKPCRTSFSCDACANPYARYLLNRCDCLSLDLESLAELALSQTSCPAKPLPVPENAYLNAVSAVSQKLSQKTETAFDQVRVLKGSCIRCCEAQDGFVLNCPGVYLVEYNADVMTDRCCPDTAALELRLDSKTVLGSRSAASIHSGESVESLSASTLVQISEGREQKLTLEKGCDHDLIVKSANIVIVKLS